MTRIEFLVTRRGNRWYVGVGSDKHGPYLSRADAVADAIDAADASGRKRCDAVVLVKESGQEATVVWTFGKNSAPD